MKILSQPKATFLLLLSKESTLLLFRLMRFDSHLLSTFLKHRFHPFLYWLSLLFDPLTIQLYCVVLEFQFHMYLFHCSSRFDHNNIFCLQYFPSPGSLDPPILQLWHVACHTSYVLFPYIHLTMILIIFLHLSLIEVHGFHPLAKNK